MSKISGFKATGKGETALAVSRKNDGYQQSIERCACQACEKQKMAGEEEKKKYKERERIPVPRIVCPA